MSNSIWKTPDQKPDTDKKEFSSFPRQVVACHISSYGIEWGVVPVSLYNPTIKIEKWCYLDDLIAQADKAERLQNDLEIAVGALKRIKEPTAWGTLYQEQELATEALEQIEHIADASKMVGQN